MMVVNDNDGGDGIVRFSSPKFSLETGMGQFTNQVAALESGSLQPDRCVRIVSPPDDTVKRSRESTHHCAWDGEASQGSQNLDQEMSGLSRSGGGHERTGFVRPR